MTNPYISRRCRHCGRTGSCWSQRYWQDGEWKRDYFHNRCFDRFKKELEK